MVKQNPYSMVFIDDGLGELAKKRYRKRRQDLAKAVGFPIVFYGLEMGPGGKNPWFYHVPTLYQDPQTLYLTGVNQLHTALIIDPVTKTEILFLPKKDSKKEFWDGIRLGVGDDNSLKTAKMVTGFRDIRDISCLDDSLIEVMKTSKKRTVGLMWHERQNGKKQMVQDSNYMFKGRVERLLKSKRPKTKVINIQNEVWRQRLVLDKVDKANALEANMLTGYALQDLMIQLKHFKTETEVNGFLTGALLQQSPYGLSFQPIVAGGQNACVLHYTKNNDRLPKNGLLLLDFGLRLQNMHADVTRVIPVNGRFNPLQKLIYEIVLKSQKAVEKQVRAGITLSQLNSLAWESINLALDKQIRQKGGKIKLAYDHSPHQVSHMIGLQVHDGDPFRDYATQPLKVGMMISNEPGVYGHFDMTIKGKRYKEWLGVRIEDDLVVQARGCVNLSSDIPKTVKDIETLLN